MESFPDTEPVVALDVASMAHQLPGFRWIENGPAAGEMNMATEERTIRLRQMFESYRGRLLGEIAEKLRQARDESRDQYLGDILDRGERFQEEDLQ